ncbi:MAG: hypothetical protein KDF56_19140, partial [Ottowia sp.]|nr:hypothetical protein [Ottowia sp.]
IDNDQVPAGVLALADEQHFLHARLALQPGTSYLFRPDQHVAARWRSLDVARVQAAMQRALGHQQASGVKEVKS